jgi:myosin heavy subunit
MDEFQFQDNRPLLNSILSKPRGILAFLDDESKKSEGTTTEVLALMRANLPSEVVEVNTTDGSFILHHHGGPVTYRADNFIEKNRDILPVDLIQLMRQSRSTHLPTLFVNQMTKTGNIITDVTNKKSNRLSVKDEKYKKKVIHPFRTDRGALFRSSGISFGTVPEVS